jgi:hypothetical protein
MTSVEEQATPPTSTPWVPVWGGAGLVYKGDWAAGTFQDGDVVVKDGIAYLCVGGPTAVAPDIQPWGGAPAAPKSFQGFFLNLNGPWQDAVPTAADGVAFTVLTDGPYLLTVGASWYHTSGGAVRTVDVYIDGVFAMTLAQWLNQGSLHMTCVPQSALVTLTAGTHRIALRHISGSASDTGDKGFLSGVPWVSAAAIGGGGAGSAVAYGTSLPASPTDGQEAILVDSLTAATYQWRFRYNAARATNRWEFIGGPPVGAFVATREARAASPTTYGDLPTVGPQVTIPVAGIYEVEVGCLFDLFAGSAGYMSYQIGATPAADVDAATQIIAGTANEGAACFASKRQTLPVGALVTKYRFDNIARYASNRRLRVSPVAVGG